MFRTYSVLVTILSGVSYSNFILLFDSISEMPAKVLHSSGAVGQVIGSSKIKQNTSRPCQSTKKRAFLTSSMGYPCVTLSGYISHLNSNLHSINPTQHIFTYPEYNQASHTTPHSDRYHWLIFQQFE